MHEFQIERKDYKRLVINLYVLFDFLTGRDFEMFYSFESN